MCQFWCELVFLVGGIVVCRRKIFTVSTISGIISHRKVKAYGGRSRLGGGPSHACVPGGCMLETTFTGISTFKLFPIPGNGTSRCRENYQNTVNHYFIAAHIFQKFTFCPIVSASNAGEQFSANDDLSTTSCFHTPFCFFSSADRFGIHTFSIGSTSTGA